jgi:hypothetical protein
MSDPYRVLVTSSRDWDHVAAVWNELSEMLREHGAVTVVHGGCRTGGDRIADGWAHIQIRDGKNVTTEIHDADWDRYGRAAGPRRNAEMVKAGADECLCFLAQCSDHRCYRSDPHGSHGAAGCARMAAEAGIPVRYFGDPAILPATAG